MLCQDLAAIFGDEELMLEHHHRLSVLNVGGPAVLPHAHLALARSDHRLNADDRALFQSFLKARTGIIGIMRNVR